MLKKITLLFSLFLSVQLSAQEPIRLTTKQGLPTNHVYDIAEDADGFMWFATKQGLVKYDGENFKTLTIQNGLPNNDTWKLELDYRGRLWYFSKSAYQGYIQHDSIYAFTYQAKKVFTPSYIYKSANNFWFYGDGAVNYLKNGKLADAGLNIKDLDAFAKEFIKKNKLSENARYFINPQRKEVVLLNFKDQQALVFDWQFQFKRKIPLPPFNKKISSSQFYYTGLLYRQIGFVTSESGVLFIDFKTNTTKFISFQEMAGLEKAKYFRCNILPTEFQISIQGHLLVFDYQLHMTNRYDFPPAISQHSYKDSRGNLWLADISKGVSMIPNTQSQTTVYLKNEKVQKVHVISRDVYVGVNNKGFFKINAATNSIKTLLEFISTDTEIYQIKQQQQSQNYVFVSALESYFLKNGTLQKIKVKGTKDQHTTNFNLSDFKDIVLYKGSNYYLGSTAIYKYTSGDSYSHLLVDKSGLKVGAVFNKHLFVGGSDGLYQLENDSLIRPDLQNNLQNTSINTFASDKTHLFVGTDGRGVYLYNGTDLVHLTATDGLSVQRILKEGDTLWLASQKGVKKVLLNKRSLSKSEIVDAFYDTDGLLQNNTNDIYKQDSLLYMACDVGLVKINLQNAVYKQQPKLYFKTIRDTLRFHNGARDNISISFGVQDYVNQEHIAYQYRLLPTQKNWTSTQTNTLNFSNLTPKVYTLEVKAVDQHNNQTIKQQYLYLIPNWWQTTLATWGFGLFGILLFLGFIKLIKTQIQKKEEAKAQQEKRISGLELQALRSQMNPHFVHNSLNAIQYFIQRNEVELSENYLSKFSQLIRLFFEYSRRQTICIKKEIELLSYYLAIEKLRFEEKLDYAIEVDPQLDQEEQLIPSMLLQPIVENAVNHGVFHKAGGGTVRIVFKYINQASFEVVVADDGIGINKSKRIFRASSKNYQSNSSKVLQERLDLLNQSKQWKIAYDVKDRSETNQELTGTIVTLNFKQLYE